MSFLSSSQELTPDPRQLPRPLSPELLIGASSPLWGYFFGAAAAGAAWWWMTRLTPRNLEALFGGGLAADAALPVLDAIEAAAEARVAPAVVGGESGPISPVLEALVEPPLEILPEVPAEPATFAEPVAAPEPEPATSKVRRTPPAAPVADA